MNTKNYKKISLILIIILNFFSINAAVRTWTGATSTNWSTSSNWAGGTAPTSADTAIIPSSLTNYPVITSANTTIRRIVINGGLSNLTNSNGRSLTVTGSMEINGGVYTASSDFATPNLTINGGSVVSGPNCDFSISSNLLINGGSINLSSANSILISSVDANNGTFTINASKATNTFGGIFSIDGGEVIVAANSGTLQPNSNGSFELISGTLNLNNQNLDIRNDFTYSGGTFTNVNTLFASVFNLDYAGTLQLNFKLKVNSNLNFINGIIKTSAAYPVIFKYNASSTGAGNNSYINGPAKKEINTSNSIPVFEFPIGNGLYYAPISISNVNNRSNNDTFTAQYFKGSNVNSNGNLGTGLNNVSTSEYWSLIRTSSTTPQTTATVSLSYDISRSGPINNATLLRIVRWDGSQWVDLGRTTNSSTSNNSGSLTATTASTGFNFFTLGSSTGVNPLPVELINFVAIKSENSVQVKWTTTSEINSDYFDVQKSTNGVNWNTIGRVKALGNSSNLNDYLFSDLNFQNGWQYYRLVQVDLNGTETLTKSVALNILNDTKLTINLSPNPACNLLTLNSNANENVDISFKIYDASGKLLLEGSDNAMLVNIDISGLSSGVYLSEVIIDGEISRIKFQK